MQSSSRCSFSTSRGTAAPLPLPPTAGVQVRSGANTPQHLFALAMQAVLAIIIVMSALVCFASQSHSQTADDQVGGVPSYQLDTGDRLRVTVFGHEDLSGEFEVSSNGVVNLPLIGEIRAHGLTVPELEAKVIGKLKPNYLKDPQVSIEVTNYRPFYIIGEVRNPGTYPYVGGMRVVNAIAMAGGFTYRADEDDFILTRGETGRAIEVGPGARVLPGDVIEVQERFF